MRSLLLIAQMLVLLPMVSSGQAFEHFRFDSVKISQDPKQPSVSSIAQDSHGYMWFATELGVYRYDGKSFKMIDLKNNQNGLIRLDEIDLLRADAQSSVWLSQKDGAIYKYNYISKYLEKYQVIRLDGTVSKDPVVDYIVNDKGEIFVLTFSGKIAVLANGNFINEIKLFVDENPYRGVINQIILDNDNVLWAKDVNGMIFRISQYDSKFMLVKVSVGGGEGVVDCNLFDNSGVVSLRFFNGDIYSYDVNHNSFIFSYSASDNGYGYDLIPAISVLCDNSNHIWVATLQDGLVVQNTKGARGAANTRYSMQHVGSIGSDIINCIYVDTGDTIWLGTTEGVKKYSKYKYKFNLSRPAVVTGQSQSNSIACIFEDSDNNIWLGTYGGGLIWCRNDAQIIRSFSLKGQYPLSQDTILGIEENNNEQLYIATIDMGLLIFDKRRNSFTKITENLQIFDVHKDSQGVLRIATFVNGLGEFDSKNNLTFWDPIVPESTQTITFDVRKIFEDSSGYLWLGTEENGAIRLSPDRRTFVIFEYLENFNSLSNNKVVDFAEDSSGNIWIATSYGLSKFNPTNNKFKNYYKSDGLSSNSVSSIVYQESVLWVATSNGLCSIRLENEAIAQFDIEDGLQASYFHVNSALVDSAGMVYMGGKNGFNYYYPDNIIINEQEAKIVINEITANGVSLTPISSDQITLPYDQSLFIAEFALLDYVRPEKNRYSFIMQGYDEDWVNVDYQQRAFYTRLPPGKYTFKVKGANSDGIWSKEESISIYVTAPFWLTPWFYVFLISAIVGIAIMVFYVRARALLEQRNRLQLEVEERTIAEARLIANQHRLREMAAELTIAEERERRKIASALHDDIGHALATAKIRLKSQLNRETGNKENQNLEHVLDNIETALDKSRSLTVDLSPPSLYQFGFQAAAEGLLERMSEDLNITSVITVEEEMQLSEENSILLYQSLRELMINIIKHSQASTVQVIIKEKEGMVHLTVTDNGIGFDTELMLNNEDGKRSYGLFSIAQRMESTGGSFKVESRPGKGTEVKLTIPTSFKNE